MYQLHQHQTKRQLYRNTNIDILVLFFATSDAGKPITKKAYKKLQKEKEKEERKAATAAKLAAEKAERDANNVVSFFFSGLWEIS